MWLRGARQGCGLCGVRARGHYGGGAARTPRPPARPPARRGDPRVLCPPVDMPFSGHWPRGDGGPKGPQPPGRRVVLEQLCGARPAGAAEAAPPPARYPSCGEPPPAVALEERERASPAWCWPLAASSTGGRRMPGISVCGSPALTCDFVNFKGHRRCTLRTPRLRTLLPPPGFPEYTTTIHRLSQSTFVVYCGFFFSFLMEQPPLSDSSAIHSHL